MSLPIFYTNPKQIDLNNKRIFITGDDYRHLVKVHRAKVNDDFLTGDGQGTKYHTRITSISPEKVEARIVHAERLEIETPSITLIQAFSQPSRMDETIIRAAECGVLKVVPFFSPRSPKITDERVFSRLLRWDKIAYEASKVARRAWPLKVEKPVDWPLNPDVIQIHDLRLLLWEDEDDMFLPKILESSPVASIGLVVGPEGGFSVEEVEMLKNHGCMSVSLGNLILRTESAGSYAAMLIRSYYGLLGSRETL